MSYVKVTDGVAQEYSFSQLRRDNPNVSFPKDPSEALLASYNVFKVTVDPMPSDGDIIAQGGFEERQGAWYRTWVVTNYTPEEKRQRMKVTMRQARLALLQQNLLSQVETAIAAMQDPEKSQVSIEWEYASTVERTSPWIGTMGNALGLTEEQLDDLFVLAATL